MAKKLFFLLCPLLFVFGRCPIKDGAIVEIPCKVVDMQGNPMKGVTLSLISSDSFDLPLKPRVEQQKTTDSKGELTFMYEHSRLLFRFIRGENQGNLVPIELFDTPNYPNEKPTPIFRYDSLVPLKIRFKSALPLMKSGAIQLFIERDVNNRNVRLLDANFPIAANRIDTLFKVNVFSQPGFSINSSLTLRDTLKQRDSTLWQAIRVLNGDKRDTVWTFNF